MTWITSVINVYQRLFVFPRDACFPFAPAEKLLHLRVDGVQCACQAFFFIFRGKHGLNPPQKKKKKKQKKTQRRASTIAPNRPIKPTRVVPVKRSLFVIIFDEHAGFHINSRVNLCG